MTYVRRGIVLSALFALVATGCGAPVEPSAAGPVDGFPVTVQNCGRELTFDKPPERVVTAMALR